MIYIIRHGESMATLDPSLFGRTDPTQIPVTERGYQQSVAAGQSLAAHIATNKDLQNWPVKLYYSPHLRIKQSAAGFLNGFQDALPIASMSEDQRIREREHGLFDGHDMAAQKLIAPEVWQKLYQGTNEEKFTTAMPGGESLHDLQQRCSDFIDDIKPFTQDHHIVVITHGMLVAGLQNCFWDQGVESWIQHDLEVVPVGTVIAMDPAGLSQNSMSLNAWSKHDSIQQKSPPPAQAFYPDLRRLTPSYGNTEKKIANLQTGVPDNLITALTSGLSASR